MTGIDTFDVTDHGTFQLNETGAAVAAVLDERASLRLKLDAAIRAARKYRDQLRAVEVERDEYREQATCFAEALIEHGHGDVVDQALFEVLDA